MLPQYDNQVKILGFINLYGSATRAAVHVGGVSGVVTLSHGETAEVVIVVGGPILAAASSNTTFAKTSNISGGGGYTVTVTGVKEGSATITISNGQADKGSVEVVIRERMSESGT